MPVVPQLRRRQRVTKRGIQYFLGQRREKETPNDPRQAKRVCGRPWGVIVEARKGRKVRQINVKIHIVRRKRDAKHRAVSTNAQGCRVKGRRRMRGALSQGWSFVRNRVWGQNLFIAGEWGKAKFPTSCATLQANSQKAKGRIKRAGSEPCAHSHHAAAVIQAKARHAATWKVARERQRGGRRGRHRVAGVVTTPKRRRKRVCWWPHVVLFE